MVCWTILALYVASEGHRLTTNPTGPSDVFAEKYQGSFLAQISLKTIQILSHRSDTLFKGV